MANTDRSGIKRSRGESQDKTKTPKTKKKQKKNKSKNNTKESESSSAPASSLETTATPDGIMMTQVLSTFNRLEQSRFEAFRRATFRGDAVSAYVAHALSAGHEQAYSRSERTRQLLNATGLGMGNPRYEIAMQQSAALLLRPEQQQRQQQRQDTTTTTTTSSMSLRLEDMVAPGQADGIVVVVSTLAKAYAQRLVAAARRVATATGYDGNQPLLPSHLQQAHTSRVQAGLDPGFFLMPSGNKCCTRGVVASSAIQAAALGTQDEYEMLRSATLQAQEEYDQYMASQPKQQEQEQALLLQQEEEGSAGPPPEARFIAEVELEPEPEPVTIPEPEPETVVKETTTTTTTHAAKPDDDNLAAAAAVEPVPPKVEDEVVAAAPAAALAPPPDNLDLDSAMLHETSALDDLPEADMGFLDDASGDDEQIGQSLEDALLNDLDDDSD